MLVVLGNKVRHQIDEDTLEGWITAYLGTITFLLVLFLLSDIDLPTLFEP